MALLGREFIAVPDEAKGQIVYKWPDVSIRRFTRAIVDVDEEALFLNKGAIAGTLGPGKHAIDADEIPFLGIFIDAATGGNAYRAELYFIGTREYTGNPFDGRVDDVQDPHTGLIVTLQIAGEYALKVVDPSAVVTNLIGTVNPSNGEITNWVASQLLKVSRTEITREIVGNGWPILGLSAYTPQLSDSLLTAANGEIAKYGLQIVGMGNFDIDLSPEDAAQLKTLAKDTAYSRLAGSFQQYAAGEAMIGAGEGMAQGGGAGGALLMAGMGALQGAAATPVGAAPPPAGFAGGSSFAGPGAVPMWQDPVKPAAVPSVGAAPMVAPTPLPSPEGTPAPTVSPTPGPPPEGNPGIPQGQVLSETPVMPPSSPTPPAAPAPLEETVLPSTASGAGSAPTCSNCGTALGEGAKFCPGCGTSREG